MSNEGVEDESGLDQRYAYSQLTDTWYRVDDWDVHNADKGQIVAKSKTEVPREDVPQEWIDGVEERDRDA